MTFRVRAGLRLTTSAAVIAISTAAMPANSQSADASGVEAVETVVVTGRVTIAKPAAEVKRDYLGVVDSLTLTDIEVLPDVNLAEVLDRVAGVSSDRFTQSSEAGSVSVRGFDARYNSMDIDGNPIWFTSQNNRGAQLALFPSSIIDEINVFKVVTPDQDANAVGGHVSLRSLRAFDGGSRDYLSLRAEAGRYNQAEVLGGSKFSYRFSGAGKTTFGPENRYGVVFGFDVQRKRNYDEYFGVDGYAQSSGDDWVNGNIYANGYYDKTITRNAIYGKFETHVSDTLYAFISANYFNEHTIQFLERNSIYVYSKYTTAYDNGIGSFTKGVGQTKEYDYDIGRNSWVLASGVDYRTSERGVLTLRGNYTTYHYKVILDYPGAFQNSAKTGTYDVSGDLPSVVINESNFTSTSSYTYKSGTKSYVQYQPLQDHVYSFRGDYNYNAYPTARGLGINTGASWVRIARNYDQSEDDYTVTSAFTLASVAGNSAFRGSTYISSWKDFWTYMKSSGTLTVDDAETSDYYLDQDELAAYVSALYTGDDFRVQVGLREEYTEFAVKTSNDDQGTVVPVLKKNSYSVLLPNIQGYYDFTDSLRLRAAFTKTIARPDFSDYAPGQSISLDTGGGEVVTGTNYKLAPRISSNYDVSLEYYFNNDDYVSVAGFFKEMKHETFTQKKETTDSDGVVVLTEQIPLNTGSARVKGIEATFVKKSFDFLPEPLDKFNLSMDYTYLDGQWNVVFTDGSTRQVAGLRNQPRWLANLRFGYRYGPASVDFSWRLRGRTFTGTFGTTAAGDRWIAPYNDLGATLKYRFGDVLSVYAQAKNLTNTYWRITTGLNDSVYQAVNGGRSYWVGMKYSID